MTAWRSGGEEKRSKKKVENQIVMQQCINDLKGTGGAEKRSKKGRKLYSNVTT
jgi:hypothetical protein